MQQTLIRQARSKRIAVSPETGGKTLTKQSFKDECDINKIMEKYRVTGAIAHLNKHEARYGFATALDFRESLEVVTEAQAQFDDLPSHIRFKFGNSPETFLAFVQDPDNAQEIGRHGSSVGRR